MNTCDLLPLSPLCATAGVAGTLTSAAANSVLDALGNSFARAVETVLDATFEAISSATTVDLTASYVGRNFSVLASVALVMIVGLFVVQVITAALRREPGGLARAITGAGTAVLGTAAAVAIIQSLLIAVDGICDTIATAAGTSIEDAARTLLDITVLSSLLGTGGSGAVLVIVFGALYIVGAVLTLATLLVREALIVVAVIIAPLAIAGGTARITSGWVRRWVQVTLALIVSKIAIVVVFVVAVGMLGSNAGIGALLSGLILILLASLAPWASFKFLDFAGTAFASDWQRTTSGATLAVAHHGASGARTVMRVVAPIVGGPASGAAAAASTSGPSGFVPSSVTTPHFPPPPGGPAGGPPPPGGATTSSPLFPSTPSHPAPASPPPAPPSSPSSSAAPAPAPSGPSPRSTP